MNYVNSVLALEYAKQYNLIFYDDNHGMAHKVACPLSTGVFR